MPYTCFEDCDLKHDRYQCMSTILAKRRRITFQLLAETSLILAAWLGTLGQSCHYGQYLTLCLCPCHPITLGEHVLSARPVSSVMSVMSVMSVRSVRSGTSDQSDRARQTSQIGHARPETRLGPRLGGTSQKRDKKTDQDTHPYTYTTCTHMHPYHMYPYHMCTRYTTYPPGTRVHTPLRGAAGYAPAKWPWGSVSEISGIEHARYICGPDRQLETDYRSAL